MSASVDINKLSIELREKINNNITVTPKESKYGQKDSVLLLDIFDDDTKVSLPFSYYKKEVSTCVGEVYPNQNKNYEKCNDYEFIGKLNKIQTEVKEEIYSLLNKNKSILISLACGQGKTFLSIFIASKLKYPTLIWCHRINLIDQWVYSINKACPTAIVQVLNSKSKINKEADFLVMNVTNVKKRSKEDFEHIGLLIVDEAHTICTENLSQSFNYIFPKYLIGLTATPDRTDGMGRILDLYFGEERIVRKLWKPFNTYVFNTGFKPKAQQNKQGNLDWNSVLEAQCINNERNNTIVDIIRYFATRNFLVLCKRVEQANYILEKLKEYEEDADIFVSSAKSFNYTSRILISTYSKTGVGFDHPKLDALIIASDVEEGVEQYIGRVFRREDVVPIIFDILDDMFILKKHHKTRRYYYELIGGVVKDFNLWFSSFYSWRKEN